MGLIQIPPIVPFITFTTKEKTIFSGPGTNPGWHIAFSCHVSLVSFDLDKLIHFSLCSLTLTLLKNASHLFCTLSFNLVCLMFSPDYIHDIHFLKERHRNDVLFSVHHIKRHMLLIFLITNDVNFDHLGKLLGFSILKVLFSHYT